MIGVDYFPMLNFQQANPLLSGIQAGQQIYGQGVQNAYLRPELQQALQREILNNQILAPQAQLAPQMAQANLQKSLLNNQQLGIQNQYLPQQDQTQIALQRAQAGAFGTEAQLNQARDWQIRNFPVQGDVGGQLAYMNYLGQTQGQNSPAYQLSQQMLHAQIAEQLARAQFFGANVGLKNLPTAVKNQLIAEGTPIGLGAGLSNIVNPATVNNGAVNSYNLAGVVPSQGVRNVAENAALKETTTNQIANQRQYSQILDNIMNQAEPLMPSVAKYAGLSGKAQLQADRLAASTGTINPDYQNYLTFTQGIAPLMANEMRRTLGGQATDSERQIMANVSNPAYWDSNPQLALQQFRTLQQVFQKAINPALAQTLSQVQKNLQNSAGNAGNTQNTQTAGPSMSKVLNGKTYVKINGQWYQQ